MQMNCDNLITNIFQMNKAFKKRHYKCKLCNNFIGANEMDIYSHKKNCEKIFVKKNL